MMFKSLAETCVAELLWDNSMFFAQEFQSSFAVSLIRDRI
jgi:hypothetical protein